MGPTEVSLQLGASSGRNDLILFFPTYRNYSGCAVSLKDGQYIGLVIDSLGLGILCIFYHCTMRISHLDLVSFAVYAIPIVRILTLKNLYISLYRVAKNDVGKKMIICWRAPAPYHSVMASHHGKQMVSFAFYAIPIFHIVEFSCPLIFKLIKFCNLLTKYPAMLQAIPIFHILEFLQLLVSSFLNHNFVIC